MKRATTLDWSTPQTKRSATAESLLSTPQEVFQDYIMNNYHAITTYKLGHINSIFISTNLAIKKITKSTICSKTPSLEGVFAATALNPSAKRNTASASETARSAARSVTALNAETKPPNSSNQKVKMSGTASA